MLSENWERLQRRQEHLTPIEKKKRRKVTTHVSTSLLFDEFRKRPNKSLEVTLLQPDAQLLTSQAKIERQASPGKFLAMDCESVGTGPKGRVSQLGRVSIVDYYGCIILDLYVKPRAFVTDWRTPYSGLSPSMLRNAIPFHEARSKVQNLLANHKIIGHAIANDFRAMELPFMPDSIDTQRLKRWSESPDIRKRPGLRKLMIQLLGIDIQKTTHDSVEDARASMLIFRLFKTDFLHPK